MNLLMLCAMLLVLQVGNIGIMKSVRKAGGTATAFASTRMQTRASSEVHVVGRNSSSRTTADIPMGTSGKRKASGKHDSDGVKLKKNAKNLSEAVKNVVYDSLQGSVPDAAELRRKREEDSLKCGRTLATVTSASNGSSSFLGKKATDVAEETAKMDVNAGLLGSRRLPSPNLSPTANSPSESQ